MIPLHLRLSGFLSYQEEVLLDFSSFDLACISGSNGAGKSSLLDAITWALFGQARKRDDAVINSHSKAAEVTLDFDYEGATYRIQRIKTREKPTMLEFRILGSDGDWRPLTERTLSDTERRIRQTLRLDYETFINASFFLQGKADVFAQQRPSERKKILSSILGLEIWEEYQKATAERRKTLEQEVSSLDGRLAEITAELSEENERRKRLADLMEALDRISSARQSQEANLEALRQLKASLDEQKKMVETQAGFLAQAHRRLDELVAQLAARQAERDEYAREIASAGEIESAYQRWLQNRSELELWDRLAERFHEYEKRREEPLREIAGLRGELENERKSLQVIADAITFSQAEKEAKERLLSAAEQTLAEAQTRLARRAELETLLRDLHQGQAEARADNPRLKAEMDELKRRIDQLSLATGAACPTCGQPLTPEHIREIIDELTVTGRGLGERYRQNQALLKDFETRSKAMERELASLASIEKTVMEQNRVVDQIKMQLSRIAQQEADWIAAGEPRLLEITRCLEENAFAPQAMARLAEVDAELKGLGYDAQAHDALRREEQVGRAAEAAFRKLGEARAALGPLEREVTGLKAQVARQREEAEHLQHSYDEALSNCEAAAAKLPDLEQAERALLDLAEKENRLRMEAGAAQQKVAILETQRQRRQALTQQRETLNRQIGRHRELERAFSKDGVPALLIEQALPEIENQANDLLDRLSGGTMSVRFATQTKYKDKTREDLRETLDIVISDGAGTRDYEMFSGGEAFRVNFAIRLALSKVLAQRAGARLQTLVVDEGFGSQDAEGRQRLIQAINVIRKDFSKVLVITHLEELKDAFPNRIEVEKTPTGSTVHVL